MSDATPRQSETFGTRRRVCAPALARLLAVVAGAMLALASLASPVSAHAALIDSSPGDGEEVASVPDAIVLTFSEPMQPPASIEVTDPEGDAVAVGEPEIEGERVTASMPALGADGTYTVRWRAVSADDHPLEGEFAFEFAQPAGEPEDEEEAGQETDSPGEAATGEGAEGAGETGPDAAEGGGAGLPGAEGDQTDPAASILPWLLAGAGLAAVAATAAAALAQRRRGAERADPA